MTRTSEYDPHEHAARIGIDVVYGRLRTANGLWVPEHRTIILRPRMRALIERTVLAHEMGHVCLGHTDSCPRNEKMADRFAARKLIDADELRRASRYSPDVDQWAIELQVTPHLIDTYMKMNRIA